MSTDKSEKKCTFSPLGGTVVLTEKHEKATSNKAYVENYLNQVMEKSSGSVDKTAGKRDLTKGQSVNADEQKINDYENAAELCNSKTNEENRTSENSIYQTLEPDFVSHIGKQTQVLNKETETLPADNGIEAIVNVEGEPLNNNVTGIGTANVQQSHQTQLSQAHAVNENGDTPSKIIAELGTVSKKETDKTDETKTSGNIESLYGKVSKVGRNTEKRNLNTEMKTSTTELNHSGFVDLEIPDDIINEITTTNVEQMSENGPQKQSTDSNVWPWLPTAPEQLKQVDHHGNQSHGDEKKWAWMEDDLNEVFHKNSVVNPNHSYSDEPVYMLYDTPVKQPTPVNQEQSNVQNPNCKWLDSSARDEENYLYGCSNLGFYWKNPNTELYTIDDVDEVLYDEPPIEAQPPIEPSINKNAADNIYENVMVGVVTQSSYPGVDAASEDDGWPSSDFETFDEDNVATSSTSTAANTSTDDKKGKSQAMMDKLKIGKVAKSPSSGSESSVKGFGRLGRRSSSRQDESDEDESVLEVYLSSDKHPAPSLKPTPAELTPQQITRRAIVSAIIDSETSYTTSLERIIEDYEKPLMQSKPQILSRSSIKSIFYKVRDILQCHNMFRIELAECIKCWDEQEVIGHVFTASFHKTMVFDVYSAFVNNFSVAMETVRHSARHKPAFADFLKQKTSKHADKLSLFGLMVKPVQRFPQFILFLQDLLKNTRKDHHDRLALQLALTELENLTHRLNETKRESENKLEVKTILSNLTGWQAPKANPHRYLIRQDDMTQMKFNQDSSQNGEATVVTKSRRLFMMNDLLMCTNVIYKDAEAGIIDKFKLKWCVPINEVEVIDSAINADYRVLSGSRSISVYSKKAVQADSPWKKELDDLLHDLPLVIKVSQLVSHLRNPYPGLTNESVTQLIQSLQGKIEEKDELDWSTIQLGVPSKSGRMLLTFQVTSPSVKQQWLFNLCTAVLNLDPKNNPGWGMPENETHVTTKLPLFMQPLLLDVTKQQDMKQSNKSPVKMCCAIPVFVPDVKVPGQVVEHLWVCSGDGHRGHITLVSLNNTLPHVVESFNSNENKVVCAELVPGFPRHAEDAAPPCFSDDTVWMATANQQIVVHKVYQKQRQEDPIFKFSVDSPVMCMSYLHHRMYMGLASGSVYIYSRTKEGEWRTSEWRVVQLDSVAVKSLLPIGKEMWCACAENIHIISLSPALNVVKHKVTINNEGDVRVMVTAGVGLIVAFQNEAVVRLFHLESMEHLQDINLASAIFRILKDKYPKTQDLSSIVRITTMMASKGLLWIGTNIGCVLSLPLPRLEGVPQIRGRPSVSYHAHKGPIRFLVPVQCSPIRASQDEPYDLDQNIIFENHVEEPAMSIQIAGVTETESSDETCDVENDMYVSEDELENFEFHVPNARLPLGSSLRSSKSRWISTPDIRSSVMDDNAYFLYGSLLRGTDLDPELEMVSPYLSLKKPKGAALYSAMRRSIRKRSSKFRKSLLESDNTTVEKCHTNEALNLVNNDEDEEEVPEDSSSSEDANKLNDPTTNTKFSQIVASGGDGYVDWNKPFDKSRGHEDICLLLWQCRI